MDLEYVDKIKFDTETKSIKFESCFDDEGDTEVPSFELLKEWFGYSYLWKEFIEGNYIYWMNGTIEDNDYLIDEILDKYKDKIISVRRIKKDIISKIIRLDNDGVIVIYSDNTVLNFRNVFFDEKAKETLEL